MSQEVLGIPLQIPNVALHFSNSILHFPVCYGKQNLASQDVLPVLME